MESLVTILELVFDFSMTGGLNMAIWRILVIIFLGSTNYIISTWVVFSKILRQNKSQKGIKNWKTLPHKLQLSNNWSVPRTKPSHPTVFLQALPFHGLLRGEKGFRCSKLVVLAGCWRYLYLLNVSRGSGTTSQPAAMRSRELESKVFLVFWARSSFDSMSAWGEGGCEKSFQHTHTTGFVWAGNSFSFWKNEKKKSIRFVVLLERRQAGMTSSSSFVVVESWKNHQETSFSYSFAKMENNFLPIVARTEGEGRWKSWRGGRCELVCDFRFYKFSFLFIPLSSFCLMFVLYACDSLCHFATKVADDSFQGR